jgi:MOSC domain-containing protein YiiM
MTDPRVRASDDDRRRVVAALEEHTAAGRLDLDEYAHRVDQVLAARTHGELDRVLGDLPAHRAPSGDQRHLLLAFLLAALVVAGFAVALSLAR